MKEIVNILEHCKTISQKDKVFLKKEKLYDFLNFFVPKNTEEVVVCYVFMLCMSILSLLIVSNIPLFLLTSISVYVIGSILLVNKVKKLSAFIENQYEIINQKRQQYLLKKEDIIFKYLVEIDQKYHQEFLKEYLMIEKERTIRKIDFLTNMLKAIQDIEISMKQKEDINEKINQIKNIYEEKEIAIEKNYRYNL